MELVNHLHQQEKVNTYFQSQLVYWKDVYSITGVQAEIIRDRHAAVLSWIDSLALAPGSRVLEIGCGAGFLAIALALRGLRVYAIDSVESMVELARQHAVEAGAASQLSLNVGDIYALAFEDACFDLVLAIGVIPWVEHASLAIREMARVTRPGGHVIITTANSTGLASLLDPLVSPAFSPLKRRVKAVLHRPSPGMTFHGNHFIDKTLAGVGLIKTRGMTRGFGFSCFRHAVCPERSGASLHQRLQRLANRNVPGFRSIGMAYLVLARKQDQVIQ